MEGTWTNRVTHLARGYSEPEKLVVLKSSDDEVGTRLGSL